MLRMQDSGRARSLQKPAKSRRLDSKPDDDTELSYPSPNRSAALDKETILVGGGSRGRVSVVTRRELGVLDSRLNALEGGLRSSLALPNESVLRDIRSGALSLPDAMAALRIESRVEAAERGIERLAVLVTRVAADASRQSASSAGHTPTTPRSATEAGQKRSNSPEVEKRLRGSKVGARTASALGVSWGDLDGYVQELDMQLAISNATSALEADILKHIASLESKLKSPADQVTQKLFILESRVNELEEIQKQIPVFEKQLRDYTNDISGLDAAMSSQIMSLQELVNELQCDLEAGLKQAMETGGGGGVDSAALAELNARVGTLASEAESAAAAQQALEGLNHTLSNDLHALLEQFEVVKEAKADREEVADTLRDKADASALNGLLSEHYFEAARAELERRQRAADDRLGACGLAWQRAIDDIHAELNEKAELTQLEPLRVYLDKRLRELHERLNVVALAAGEPRAAAVTRRLLRDAECLSCATPAAMAPECAPPVPRLPAATVRGALPPAAGAEHPTTPDLCLADYAPEEKQVHMCHRYCGGSHTLVPMGVVTRARFPDALRVRPAARRRDLTAGLDGQMYLTEELLQGRPCTPCNAPAPPLAF